MTTETRTVPLSSLSLHPFNPRQEHDLDDCTALAQSIAINGLMQNLSVFEGPDGLGVVAGGRRLLALQCLQETGAEHSAENPVDFDAIPVRVTDDEALALSWAGSESATQKPLHPADEVRAYAAMANKGSPAELIARAFAQTVAHVKRRLKLSALPTPTLDALRSGQISLDAAKVLTLCTSDEQHDSFLRCAIDGDNHTWLRNQLTFARVPSTDRRVIYVGIARYISEGGTVDEDLFAERSLLNDADLLQRLFEEKLTNEAATLAEQGIWGQVIPIFEHYVEYTHTQALQRCYRVPVDLPEADATELENLEERGETEELTEAELARRDELEARAEGDYSSEDIAAGTLFLLVGSEGKVKTEGPFLRSQSRNAQLNDDRGGGKVAAKPAITQGGIDDLHRIERIALQTQMIHQPELALDLLAFQLWHEMRSFAGPFNIQTSYQNTLPSCTDSVTIDKRVSGEADEAAETLDADILTSFDTFIAKGKKHRNTVLTTLLARTMNAPFGNPTNRALLARLNITPRSVWTPTAANHFKACRSETLDGIWRKLVITEDNDDEMARFSKLKVGEKQKELDALFSDASVQEALGLNRAQVAAIDAWLPTELVHEAMT